MKKKKREIEDAVSRKYNEIADVVIVTKDKINAELSEELNSKLHIIGQAMSQEMGPFKTDISRDMDRLRYDVRQMNNDIYDAYRKDEFYLKTAADGARTACDVVSDYANVAISKTADGLREATHCMTDAYDRAKNNVADYYVYTIRRMSRMYNEMKHKINEINDRTLKYLKETANELAVAFYDALTQAMRNLADSAHAFITKYAPFLETCYYECKDKIQRFYQNALEYFTKATDATYYYFVDYAEAGRRFHDEYLRDVYVGAYEKISQLFRSLGIDNLVNSAAVVSYQKIKTLALSTLQECIDDFASVSSGIKYEFDLTNGEITLEIPLPSPKASLREAFDVTTYPEYENLVQLNDAFFAGEDYCIWDTYYKYKHYLMESFKIPPFETYAMIAGNQHYITFDKFHFDFAGECSYLLARDFVDGNFTVTVNYARDGRDVVRKSLTILSNEKKIDIGSDYKVTVDDAKVELPQIIEDSFIIREGSVVTVRNDKGFTIKCNFVHDLCTVHMSGFYFSKTGGLFGTYDYEPQLDLMTPQRILVDDIGTFANSWEIGNAVCTRGPNMAVITNNDYRAKEVCKKLFDDKESNFRPCYKLIEPMRYYEMCMKDLSRYDSSMFDEKICTAAATYMTECNAAGVPVRMPKSCVRCEKHDGNIMTSGDVIKITESEQVQSADIVFIVEKKACNQDNVRTLARLALGIEESLQIKSYSNIRYAVVGFGGKGPYNAPHLQTNDGNEFGSIRSIDSAFASLTTSEWSTEEDEKNSVFEAIRYAAGLPFRIGSVKSFVLLKCSECKAEEVKADYSEMLRTLLDGDITLHLLIKHEFEMKDNRTPRGKRVRIMGLDRRVAYTSKDVKDPELSGDRDLLAQLKIPKDFCVPLALEVNGSLFASQMLTETKRNAYKRFIDVMSRRLAKTARPSECQVCECISTPDGIGKSVCQRCVSPVVAEMISPDISPIIYSSDDWYNDEPYRPEENRANSKQTKKWKSKKRQ